MKKKIKTKKLIFFQNSKRKYLFEGIGPLEWEGTIFQRGHISLAYIKNIKNLTIQFAFIIYYKILSKKFNKVKFFFFGGGNNCAYRFWYRLFYAIKIVI